MNSSEKPPTTSAERSAAPGETRLVSPEFLQHPVDEDENLLALERLLTRASGFTLAFVRVNEPAQRAALVQEIRRRVEPQGLVIIEINLTTPIPDFLAELVRRFHTLVGKLEPATANGPRLAVFVYGLEHSIATAGDQPALAVINYKRENFRERIPLPLVLWLPEEALQALITGAPDFWAWRSGLFEFATPQEKTRKHAKRREQTMNKAETVLPSRALTDEDSFYLKLARDEFAASLGRLEETAKYLVGAIGAVAGLVLAGIQIKIAVKPDLPASSFAVPFLLWGFSALCAILVFFPLPYRHYQDAPAAIRRAFERARKVKWALLLISVLAFAAGLYFAASIL